MSVPQSKVIPRDAVAPAARDRRDAWIAVAGMAFVLALGFALCFYWQWAGLWRMWMSDPLRSIGIAIPAASLILAVRAWRLRDFAQDGSWWGLPLALVAAAVALIAAASPLQAVFPIHAGRYLHVNLVPVGALICAYASGVVLLFGGVSAWRRAWFPLLLLLFVNPAPGFFNTLVDLPLQYFASHMARGFAVLIGVPVSEGTLRMMFTPHLGMFIAPGCDGMRGALTMGYLALVMGYLYRLRWLRWGSYVIAAVVLAYLFNLVRLCGVVIYYWFAMHIPAIANHGTLIDYLIGGVLFFLAALFLFSVPRWWRDKPGDKACMPS